MILDITILIVLIFDLIVNIIVLRKINRGVTADSGKE